MPDCVTMVRYTPGHLQLYSSDEVNDKREYTESATEVRWEIDKSDDKYLRCFSGKSLVGYCSKSADWNLGAWGFLVIRKTFKSSSGTYCASE